VPASLAHRPVIAQHRARECAVLLHRRGGLTARQLLCEGHNEAMQDCLREQPGSQVSVNILQDLLELLGVMTKDTHRLSRTSPKILYQLLATITEVIQGPCKKNQV
jgi:hypothetical protein